MTKLTPTERTIADLLRHCCDADGDPNLDVVATIASDLDAKDGVIRQMWEDGNMAQTNIESLKAQLSQAQALLVKEKDYVLSVRAESLSRFDEMTRRNNRILKLERELDEARGTIIADRKFADGQYAEDERKEQQYLGALREVRAERDRLSKDVGLLRNMAEADRRTIDRLSVKAEAWDNWCAFLDANPQRSIGLLAHDWVAAARARELDQTTKE